MVSVVVMVAVVGLAGGAGEDRAGRGEPPARSSTGAPAQAPPNVLGPAVVALGDRAEVEVPAGMIAFDRAAARRLLRGIGEPSDGVVGIVLAPGADWRLIISDAETGFLDDVDASSLDAGELMAAYTEGNRARNDRRQAIGAPALVIDGWAEPPRYDRGAHRLTWSLAGHTDRGPLVNSFTRILGRHGFLSVTLVDTAEAIGRSRQQVGAVLGAIRFRPGFRYEDHQAGDRRAIGGLRGLVIGPTEVTVGAAPGLLARLVAGLRRSMLVILTILVGLGGLVPRLLARRMRPAVSERRPSRRG